MTLKNQAIQTAFEGNWQKAIAINKSLIQEDPNDIDAFNRLALAYTITGKLKEAKITYQKVLNLDVLNPIALRNLKKLKEKGLTQGSINQNTQINNKFIEEPGKTKVVELINIAQPNVVENLRTGQSVELSIKRLKIFISEGKQYIGVLPDDIAKRLIKLMKNGCVYEAYIKSANQHKVTVFINEIKKTVKFKNYPSFISISESPLGLDRGGKFKDRVQEEKLKKSEQSEDEEENYSEED